MNEPRYNIRAVERLTGIPAPTLRSWERRYGFPVPGRTDTARRLYSGSEIDAILWVKAQRELGVSIAQAIHLVQNGRSGLPLTPSAQSEPSRPEATPRVSNAGTDGDPAALALAMVDAVARYDEPTVNALLSRAFARHSAAVVITEMIRPALVEIGERWARGELPISAEHFASGLIERRLAALLAEQPPANPGPVVVLACVEGEQHQIGLLMLAVFLRWAGARVVYLGADVPMSDLVRVAHETAAAAICLSAIDPSSAHALHATVQYLRQAGLQTPLFAGGAGATAEPLPGALTPAGDLHAVSAAVMAALRF